MSEKSFEKQLIATELRCKDRDAEIARLQAQLTAAQRQAAQWEINYHQADAACQTAQNERDAARESRRRLVGLVRRYKLILDLEDEFDRMGYDLAAPGTEAQP